MEPKIQVASTVKSSTGYFRKAIVLSFLPQSRTMVIVKDIDKGAGWNEKEERYEGIKKPGSWMRGENHTYGQEFTRHINELILQP